MCLLLWSKHDLNKVVLCENCLKKSPDDRYQSAADLAVALLPFAPKRARTVVDLAQSARFYVAAQPLSYDEKASALLDEKGRGLLRELAEAFDGEPDFTAAVLEAQVRAFAEARGEKLGKVAQPLRAALTGSTVSPPIFEVAELLGREVTLSRIRDAAGAA